MSLAAGTRLGPYEIGSPIGQGGMGEVYRARDTKLDREVAIKVLPEEFAKDEERLARFEREAKLLASLNHPNIASIHGLEESDGVKALVLELVEGLTLAERIKEAPIPVDEAIAIAKQIAAALEAGHEAGVIHRDLKPANIKLKEDGTVKVLDYGLAKAMEGETASGADSGISKSPTLTRHGTQIGVILGTAAYMSPEQAKGKRVDKRTDIFAFGAVVYEMLTGRRAFRGEDVAETLASVIKSDLDWNQIPRDTPHRLRELLGRCLEKNPQKRRRDIGDVNVELEGLDDRGDDLHLQSVEAASISRPTGRQWIVPWTIAALAVLSAAILLWRSASSDPPQPVTRFSIDVAEELTLGRVVALSPDGNDLVYGANAQLFLRPMEREEATAIPGTEGGSRPFFSPDGTWIGFFAETELKKVPRDGGASQTLAVVNVSGGGNTTGLWGADDYIYFDLQGQTGLFRVRASGGQPEPVTRLSGHEGDHTRPEAIPDSRHILFSTLTDFSWETTRVELVDTKTGARSIVLTGGSAAQYVDSGHLVYANAGSLFAIPFDPERRLVTGVPVQVVEGVRMGHAASAPQFAVSRNGTLAYVEGGASDDSVGGSPEARFVWVDRRGRVEPLSLEPGRYNAARISPTGERLAIRRGPVGSSDQGLLIAEVGGEDVRRLTYHYDAFPIWTPEDEQIVFTSFREGIADLFNLAADGSGEVTRLQESQFSVMPTSFSAGGELLVMGEHHPHETGWDLVTYPLAKGGPATAVLHTPATERNGEVSPDGQWLAYESDQTGRLEIYVRPFPDVSSGRWQVSSNGGMAPMWAPDGTELFYAGVQGMMAVPVRTASTFEHGVPELLFETADYSLTTIWNARAYDLSPDGQRFLVLAWAQPAGDSSTTRIHVVRNLSDELKRLVPTEN